MHLAGPVQESTIATKPVTPRPADPANSQQLMQHEVVVHRQSLLEIRPNLHHSPWASGLAREDPTSVNDQTVTDEMIQAVGAPRGRRIRGEMEQPKLLKAREECSKASTTTLTQVHIQIAKKDYGVVFPDQGGQALLQRQQGGQKVIQWSALMRQMGSNQANTPLERWDLYSTTEVRMSHLAAAPIRKAISIKPKGKVTEASTGLGCEDDISLTLRHTDGQMWVLFTHPPHFLESNGMQVNAKVMQSCEGQFKRLSLNIPSAKLQQTVVQLITG